MIPPRLVPSQVPLQPPLQLPLQPLAQLPVQPEHPEQLVHPPVQAPEQPPSQPSQPPEDRSAVSSACCPAPAGAPGVFRACRTESRSRSSSSRLWASVPRLAADSISAAAPPIRSALRRNCLRPVIPLCSPWFRSSVMPQHTFPDRLHLSGSILALGLNLLSIIYRKRLRKGEKSSRFRAWRN